MYGLFCESVRNILKGSFYYLTILTRSQSPLMRKLQDAKDDGKDIYKTAKNHQDASPRCFVVD